MIAAAAEQEKIDGKVGGNVNAASENNNAMGTHLCKGFSAMMVGVMQAPSGRSASEIADDLKRDSGSECPPATAAPTTHPHRQTTTHAHAHLHPDADLLRCWESKVIFVALAEPMLATQCHMTRAALRAPTLPAIARSARILTSLVALAIHLRYICDDPSAVAAVAAAVASAWAATASPRSVGLKLARSRRGSDPGACPADGPAAACYTEPAAAQSRTPGPAPPTGRPPGAAALTVEGPGLPRGRGQSPGLSKIMMGTGSCGPMGGTS